MKSETQKKTQIQKKELEWITACNVDNVDKKDEFDPYLVGAYCKQIFEYLMTLEVIFNGYKLFRCVLILIYY